MTDRKAFSLLLPDICFPGVVVVLKKSYLVKEMTLLCDGGIPSTNP